MEIYKAKLEGLTIERWFDHKEGQNNRRPSNNRRRFDNCTRYTTVNILQNQRVTAEVVKTVDILSDETTTWGIRE
jgi:hypothetical protein